MSIQDLIAKLESADGASRELDWRIAEAFDIPEKWMRSSDWPPFMVGSKFDKGIPAFTGSLDAAAKLAERLLAGAQVMIGWNQTPSTKPWARFGAWTGADATGATPAIALIIAALSALSQQEESRG
ncbi:hypothetical protein GR212_15930 [Rhizobium lusitanum]|uniref:Phage ABA sandwich domain-containing protein n=1 Tax=Rhizobium lusitanum TaxID=293958 RepID=A0A6L9U6N2_9HYPH|nr:hypothetical protein [Rhizobium lusitanum]NEI71069.1 hypothetical protein [Rhizobium lusitanum]